MHSPPSQPKSAQTPLQLPHLCTSCTSPTDILQQSSTSDHLCTRHPLSLNLHKLPSNSLTSAPPAPAQTTFCSSPAILITYALADFFSLSHTTPPPTPSPLHPLQQPTQIARLRHPQLHDSWPFIKPRNTLHPTTGPHPCSIPLR